MAKYDVAIVGGGPAGCTAAALLAKAGKKVVLFEKSDYLGGRNITYKRDGYTLYLGAHMLEDPGSGMTKILEYLGKEMKHVPANDALAIYQDGKWYNFHELYKTDRAEQKKVIQKLMETDFAELDKYDDVALRTWILQHTEDQGVIELFEFIAMLECLTYNPSLATYFTKPLCDKASDHSTLIL